MISLWATPLPAQHLCSSEHCCTGDSKYWSDSHTPPPHSVRPKASSSKQLYQPGTPTRYANLDCYTSYAQLKGFYDLPDSLCWWEDENGFTYSGKTLITAQPGIYTFYAKNPQNGSVSKSIAQVFDARVYPKLQVLSEPITCQKSESTLHLAALPYRLQFEWSGPDGFSSKSASPTVRQPGTYHLTVTEPSSGCSISTTIEVPADMTTPIARIAPPDTLSAQRMSIWLQADGSSSGSPFQYFWWKDADLITQQNTIPHRIEVNSAGDYTLMIVNTLNGCQAQKTVKVVATSDQFSSFHAQQSKPTHPIKLPPFAITTKHFRECKRKENPAAKWHAQKDGAIDR